MPQYIFVYLGGEYPSDPQEGQKHFAKYQQWLHSLGDAVLSPAIPFKDTHTVQPDGSTSPGSMSAMSGMSILQMNSMQEAHGVEETERTDAYRDEVLARLAEIERKLDARNR